jgi:hypothetical protein
VGGGGEKRKRVRTNDNNPGEPWRESHEKHKSRSIIRLVLAMKERNKEIKGKKASQEKETFAAEGKARRE